MNFKQFSTSDNQWHDVPYYQHKTATDTLTLPAVIYPNDTSITLGIKGNTVQNGTPTPTTPIIPQECGERTGNLFDAATAYGSMYNDGVVSGTTYSIYGVKNYFTDEQIGKQITLTIKADKVTATRIFIRSVIQGATTDSLSIYKDRTGYMSITVTPQSTSDYWRISYGDYEFEECILSEFMLNSGSTALPYEPYGYKIPISSAGQTTPIYLGEVETERKVKKLVFEGTENVDLNTVDKNRLIVQAVYTLPKSGTTTATNIICSHLKTLGSGSATSLEQGITMRYNGTDILFGVPFSLIGATAEDTNATIRTKLKSYLTAQYAAGTPVTVWYVLANEETAVVNEPLNKIGSYSDSLTTSIPCTAGENTLDVQTTVAPSEVTANYHGWHPVTNVHVYPDSW